jgi:hypothetical protein
VAAGNATITVTTTDGNKTATCAVTVKPITSATLAAYLSTLPANTASTSYNITLKLTSTDEFSAIKTALNGAPNKYVYLDLSGSTITTIPDSAFNDGIPNPPYSTGCDTLTGIIIPSGVTNIGLYAFERCSSLSSVTIPNGVTVIKQAAFAYCNSLTSIIIPEGVTTIYYDAFIYSSLSSVSIPNSVTFIGGGAFANCSNLSTINVGSGNNAYTSDNGVLYNKNKTSLLSYPAGKTETSFFIPNSVTSIENYAFYGCASLVSVNLPNSVTSIGSEAFFNCTSLSSVNIPNGITSIAYCAFSYCSSLDNVIIPDSVTSISKQAFGFCSSLTNITIPGSVTSIGEFAFTNCTSLSSVEFKGTIPSNDFNSSSGTFPGNLRSKFYETDSANGTPGLYTRSSNGSTWTLQQ